MDEQNQTGDHAQKNPSYAYNARAFEAIVPGGPILAVTCPILADTLLPKFLGRSFWDYLPVLFRTLSRIARHPKGGVLVGTARDIGPRESPVMSYLNVAIDIEAKPVLETGADLKQWGARTIGTGAARWASREANETFSSSNVRDHGAAFAAKHPWLALTQIPPEEFAYAAIDADPRTQALELNSIIVDSNLTEFGRFDKTEEIETLRRATEDEEAMTRAIELLVTKPLEHPTISLAFSDTEGNRVMLRKAFEEVVARLKKGDRYYHRP